MLSFTPLFLIITAALILHEVPSLIGIAGIITIVAGSYILNTSAGHTNLLDPFREMISHPGILSMFVGSFLYAISIGFDKMVVLNSDAVFGSGVVFLVLGSVFLAISLLKRLSGTAGTSMVSINPAPGTGFTSIALRNLLVPGIVIGAIITIEAITINAAYLDQIVPYVIAIKRMSILITVLYGTLVFREKEIFRRISGAGLMVFGVVLILLFP
jgi:drug/metabolite transporter (DMT)-like permease